MILELVKVSKFYGVKLVFKNISLALDPGHILLVTGPNGSGKTTLLKIMAGLARPTAGEVRLNAPKEKLGYLGHSTFIYPGLSGEDNLRIWARLYGVNDANAKVKKALARVGLTAAAMEKAGHYSRGMAQRLSLARILITGPDLIFLDEPGTGLDVKSRVLLAEEIIAARQRGASVVWVSHDAANDVRLADRVLTLENQEAVYFGPAEGYVPEAADAG